MTFGGPYLMAPLPTMLGIRPGMNVSIVNPPTGFLEVLLPLPSGAALVDSAKLGVDLAIIFTVRKTELVEKLTAAVRQMSVTGSIWIIFQHAAEGAHVPSEDFIRLAALELGLTDVKKLLLDPDWTGLKLQARARAPRLETPRAEA